MDESVRYRAQGRIAVFIFNRPAQRNAVDPAITARMNELVPAFEADPALRAGVVTGAGDEAFSAGADLKALGNGRLDEIVDVEPGGFAGLTRGARRKPLVAAVNGTAVGGGMEIALACDVIVAAEHALFGIPEVRRGIIAGEGGLQRLPRVIPPLRALELVLTGRMLDAREAHDLGLVAEIVPGDRVLARAIEIAEAIAANAPMAVEESRAIARAAIAESEAAAWELTAAAWPRILASHDAAEGPRAFSERREPVWTGR